MYQNSSQLPYDAQTMGLSLFNANILSSQSFTPFFYYFNSPAEYMNLHNFYDVGKFYFQAPTQTVQNVEQPKTKEIFPSFQKKYQNQNGKIQVGEKSSSHRQGENKQKFGRNIVSNIFHLMIKFVRRSKAMRERIIKVIQKYGMIIKINEFHHIFKKMAGKVNPYATDSQMKEIWAGPQKNENCQSIKAQKERQCCKIFRILGRVYLERYHLPYVYNSRKIKSESKRLHRSCIRKIYAV